MEYTKGNWKIHRRNNWERGNKLLIESIQINPEPDIQQRTTPIAELTYFDDLANAHLISASPDMYEALKAVESSVICNGDFSITYAIDGRIKKQIAEALAKAEGINV